MIVAPSVDTFTSCAAADTGTVASVEPSAGDAFTSVALATSRAKRARPSVATSSASMSGAVVASGNSWSSVLPNVDASSTSTCSVPAIDA